MKSARRRIQRDWCTLFFATSVQMFSLPAIGWWSRRSNEGAPRSSVHPPTMVSAIVDFLARPSIRSQTPASPGSPRVLWEAKLKIKMMLRQFEPKFQCETPSNAVKRNVSYQGCGQNFNWMGQHNMFELVRRHDRLAKTMRSID